MSVIKKKQVTEGTVVRSEYYTTGRGVLKTVEKIKEERIVFMSEMCMRRQCVYDVLAHMTCKNCKYKFPQF